MACKVGCHYEGVRPRYMFVNGQKTKETYSLFAEDAGDGFIHRLIARHAMPESVHRKGSLLFLRTWVMSR